MRALLLFVFFPFQANARPAALSKSSKNLAFFGHKNRDSTIRIVKEKDDFSKEILKKKITSLELEATNLERDAFRTEQKVGLLDEKISTLKCQQEEITLEANDIELRIKLQRNWTLDKLQEKEKLLQRVDELRNRASTYSIQRQLKAIKKYKLVWDARITKIQACQLRQQASLYRIEIRFK